MNHNGSNKNQTQKDTIRYGQALVKAIQAFKVLEPKAGLFETLQIKFLRATYQERLRYLVGTLPVDVAEEILKGDE